MTPHDECHSMTEGGSGRMMRPLVVLAWSVLALIAVTSAAPAVVKDASEASEKPLIRTKRAEEIIFGNHQNEPRVKKSADDQLATHDVIKRGIDVTDDEEGDSSVAQGELASDDVKENWPAAAGGRNDEEEDEEAVEKLHQEAAEERREELEAAAVGEPTGENFIGTDSETPTDDDLRTQELIDAAYAEPSRSEESTEEEINDSMLDDAYRTKRSAVVSGDTRREKRSVSGGHLMTAENMAAGPGASTLGETRMRTKRDLSYNELRNILKAENAAPYYDDDDVLEDGIKRSAYLDENFVEEGGDEQEDLEPERVEEEVEREEEFEEANNRARDEERIEEALIRYELLKNLRKEKKEEQAREAVLDYLIEAAEERQREAEREREAEIEAEREREIQEEESTPSYYQTRLSKRYPYSYEPYGGRWGAAVPGQKRDRATVTNQRLFRLAQALADNEVREREEEAEEEEKKK